MLRYFWGNMFSGKIFGVKIVLINKRGKLLSMEYRELIENHFDSLWFAALRFTRDKEDAEDLVQETCLKVLENLDSLRSEDKAKAWMLKILTNTFINKYRKNQASSAMLDVESELVEPIFYKSGQYLDLERDIFSRVMDDEVKSALDDLPVEFRMAVLLVDIEELSYREVEDILNISPGTLASRLYRGRRLLRDALHEYAAKKGFLREVKR